MRVSVATAKAIRYACMNFHYAKAVPSVQYGFNVFNDADEWCGVILYGGGANRNAPKEFGVCAGEILELVRCALNGKQGHGNTSKAVAMTMKELHKINPLVKMLISYADMDQEHAGIIYQATNWIYLGKTNCGEVSAFIINGVKTHMKSVYSRYGTDSYKWLQENVDHDVQPFYTKGKHKYIYCYNKAMKKQWMMKAQPYPKVGGDSNGKRTKPTPLHQ